MTFESGNEIEHFLSRLELKLQLPKHRIREIIDELRAELLAQKSAHLDAGRSEQEAEDLVMDSLGDPDQLAAEMSQTVAPASGGVLRVVRYVVALGIIVWALKVLWYVRAWSYGFSPLTTGGILAFHLVPVLLVWPGTVWRPNWLFGLIALAVGILLLIAMNAVGTVASMTIHLDEPPVMETLEANSSPIEGKLMLVTFIVAAVFLITAIQRRRQRWRVIAIALLAFGLIEGVYLQEESKFRADRDRLVLAFRTGEELQETGIRTRERDGELSLFWQRKLCPGFSIGYSSADDRVWIND